MSDLRSQIKQDLEKLILDLGSEIFELSSLSTASDFSKEEIQLPKRRVLNQRVELARLSNSLRSVHERCPRHTRKCPTN